MKILIVGLSLFLFGCCGDFNAHHVIIKYDGYTIPLGYRVWATDPKEYQRTLILYEDTIMRDVYVPEHTYLKIVRVNGLTGEQVLLYSFIVMDRDYRIICDEGLTRCEEK